MFIRNSKTYHINVNVAEENLQKIFASCDKEVNTIPLRELVPQQKEISKIYNVLLIITGILLILTVFSPLYIISLLGVL